MAFIKTQWGIINTEGLLTVRVENTAGWGWCILLEYKGEKSPKVIRCDNEENAKKCLEEITDGL